jgi:hypothetical protein
MWPLFQCTGRYSIPFRANYIDDTALGTFQEENTEIKILISKQQKKLDKLLAKVSLFLNKKKSTTTTTKPLIPNFNQKN